VHTLHVLKIISTYIVEQFKQLNNDFLNERLYDLTNRLSAYFLQIQQKYLVSFSFVFDLTISFFKSSGFFAQYLQGGFFSNLSLGSFCSDFFQNKSTTYNTFHFLLYILHSVKFNFLQFLSPSSMFLYAND